MLKKIIVRFLLKWLAIPVLVLVTILVLVFRTTDEEVAALENSPMQVSTSTSKTQVYRQLAVYDSEITAISDGIQDIQGVPEVNIDTEKFDSEDFVTINTRLYELSYDLYYKDMVDNGYVSHPLLVLAISMRELGPSAPSVSNLFPASQLKLASLGSLEAAIDNWCLADVISNEVVPALQFNGYVSTSGEIIGADTQGPNAAGPVQCTPEWGFVTGEMQPGMETDPTLFYHIQSEKDTVESMNLLAFSKLKSDRGREAWGQLQAIKGSVYTYDGNTYSSVGSTRGDRWYIQGILRRFRNEHIKMLTTKYPNEEQSWLDYAGDNPYTVIACYYMAHGHGTGFLTNRTCSSHASTWEHTDAIQAIRKVIEDPVAMESLKALVRDRYNKSSASSIHRFSSYELGVWWNDNVANTGPSVGWYVNNLSGIQAGTAPSPMTLYGIGAVAQLMYLEMVFGMLE